MARPQRKQLKLTQLLGMNQSDPAISLPPGQARSIVNVDLFESGLGAKRAGHTAAPTTGTPPTGLANQRIVAMYLHSPDGLDNTSELWVARTTALGGLSGTFYRFAGGIWSTVVAPDTPDGDVEVSFTTFNKKLFIAYNSALNRLHLWDGATIRRVGLAPPAAAPGLASAGAGALAFTRFYRVRFISNNGPRISEPSPAASITIAASSGVTISRPPQVDGDESSWVVDAANLLAGPYYQITSNIPIGTLSVVDASATVSTLVPSAELGTYQLPPSCKYLSVYKQQVLMAGAWETTAIAGQTVPAQNRVWFTRPLHTLDLSDDESVPTTATFKFWTDLSEDGDRIAGLSYPLEGIPYSFKSRQIWSLVPTDDATVPFRAVRLSDAVGCRDYRSIVIGEDENGNPALYWGSLRGPYRTGRAGLQCLIRDFDNAPVGPHQANRAIWFADQRQVYFAVDNESQYWKFNPRYGNAQAGDVRNGWTLDTFGTPQINCLGSFFQGFTLPLTNIGILQPLIGGFTVAGGSLLYQRDPTVRQDAGVNYQSAITTAAYTLGDLLYNVKLYMPRVYADVSPPAAFTYVLTCTITPNLGGPPQGPTTESGTASMGFVTGIPTSIATFEGLQWSDAEVYSFTIGDGAPINQGWKLNAFMVPYEIAQEAE